MELIRNICRFLHASTIWRIATILLMAVALSTTAAASAQAAISHPGATHPAALHLSRSHLILRQANPCGSIPAHNFCAVQFYDSATDTCFGSFQYVSAATYHSAWYNFNNINVPFHPECIINPTNSSVWIEDEAIEFASCAPANGTVVLINAQAGWFFVKYNITTCGSDPSGA